MAAFTAVAMALLAAGVTIYLFPGVAQAIVQWKERILQLGLAAFGLLSIIYLLSSGVMGYVILGAIGAFLMALTVWYENPFSPLLSAIRGFIP